MKAGFTLLLVITIMLCFALIWLLNDTPDQENTSPLVPEPTSAIQMSPVIPPVNAVCPDDIDIVCGSDGNTYTNPCLAESQPGVTVEKLGPCEP